jgi:hypothetical protein
MFLMNRELFEKMNHAARLGVRPHVIGNVGSPIDATSESTNNALTKRGKLVIVRNPSSPIENPSFILMSDVSHYGRAKYILGSDYEVYHFKASVYWGVLFDFYLHKHTKGTKRGYKFLKIFIQKYHAIF